MRSVLNTKSVIYIASLLVLMNMLSLNEKCCNAISYLDFRTVRYHTFKSVVTKGGRNKCSHLLFIHQTSSSDKSKLFVGGCMKKMINPSPRNPLSFFTNHLRGMFWILKMQRGEFIFSPPLCAKRRC